jgi:hypothetical protein
MGMDLPLPPTGRLQLCPMLWGWHNLHFPFIFTRLRTERKEVKVLLQRWWG